MMGWQRQLACPSTSDKGTAVGYQVDRGVCMRVISEIAWSSNFQKPDGQDWQLATALLVIGTI